MDSSKEKISHFIYHTSQKVRGALAQDRLFSIELSPRKGSVKRRCYTICCNAKLFPLRSEAKLSVRGRSIHMPFGINIPMLIYMKIINMRIP